LIGLGLSTWLFFREREARRQESQLRAEAEERAKITQAVMFVSLGKYEDANQILNEEEPSLASPTLDKVSVLRSVGEWMALQGRWAEAVERYSALIKIDKLDSQLTLTFDYQAFGVVLIEDGDTEQYGRFWQGAVTNFAAVPNSGVFIACLLRPLNQQQIQALKPMADTLQQNLRLISQSRVSDWTLMPFGLWQYRCGDYDAAIDWCQRGLKRNTKFPVCDAALHIIMAMAYQQEGQGDAACAELARGRQIVEAKFKNPPDRGRAGSGFWFDWIYDRLLLQEAATLIHCDSTPDEMN
jgi:tetratricopeptide (TPR) repeat protein